MKASASEAFIIFLMEKFGFEERDTFLDPVNFFDIDQGKHFYRRSADRAGLNLSVKPNIENDLTYPSIQTAFKCIQKAVVNPCLQFFKDIKQPCAVNIEMRAVHDDHIKHINVRLVKDLVVGFEILGISLGQDRPCGIQMLRIMCVCIVRTLKI